MGMLLYGREREGGFIVNEDSKKFLFGLTDIDKIQAEIEQDLKSPSERPLGRISEVKPDVAGDVIRLEDSLLPAGSPNNLLPDDLPEWYKQSENVLPESPVPRKSLSMAAAVVLFLVCTLGMGSLGFGIGFGWGVFTGRSDEDVAAEVIDDVPDNIYLTGTRPVFETVYAEPTVGSLADMIELLVPTVVSITTHRDREASHFLPINTYGSGIIFAEVEDRIFIATSLYVVRRGYRWDVSIGGSQPITARPVEYNREMDLAVLSIYKSQLEAAGIFTIAFASFGDSDTMRVGDVVLAIGNAMGEGTSVTRGVVSAMEKPLSLPLPGRPDHYINVLQTDAAINYGNSGGPLFNTRGEIIGININQVFGVAQVEGMGYSISSNLAAPALEAMVSLYRRPAIGISGLSLEDDSLNRAEYWGIPPLGVLVETVAEGRAAYLAGIRPFDVITGFNGQPIFDFTQLQEAIIACAVGDIVEVRILRDGDTPLTLRLELLEMVRETF